MEAFLASFGSLVRFALHGFDRLVFRGHLRQLSYPHGMDCYLSANQVLLKDFKDHAIERTACLTEASLAEAERLQRPVIFLRSAATSKEEEARRILQRDRLTEGLICVFKSVEPCQTFEVHRNRERKLLELQSKWGKCTHLYQYRLHPIFGLMYARLQTWFPYAVQIGINGREWLARQLDQEGLGYERQGNKFSDLQDPARAQALLDEQVRTPWPVRLEQILGQLHPTHPQLLGRLPVAYYWSVFQSEWASDVVLKGHAELERRIEPWLRHALLTYRSADVMRFLGQAVTLSGQVRQDFQGEVRSTGSRREDGLRIKHWVLGNSVKLYTYLLGLMLAGVRIETTINQSDAFREFRVPEGKPEQPAAWLPLRRGVASLERRTQISQAINDRYAAATAAVHVKTPLKELAGPLCSRAPAPGKVRGRKVRALNPLAKEDAALLRAVNDPVHAVQGLRNRDLVRLLYAKPARTRCEQQRRSARVTRWIRLLRAHGILHKIPKTHRYQVSSRGRDAMTVLLAARNASTEMLAGNAA